MGHLRHLGQKKRAYEIGLSTDSHDFESILLYLRAVLEDNLHLMPGMTAIVTLEK